jgi:hypothetical protein
MDARTFPPGVLEGHDSLKGFRLVGSDGPVGKVSWASYAPGESYLVVTVGRFWRKHRVVSAGAVTRVTDGDVHVAFTRDEIRELPNLPHPQAVVDELLLARIEYAYARTAWTGAS